MRDRLDTDPITTKTTLLSLERFPTHWHKDFQSFVLTNWAIWTMPTFFQHIASTTLDHFSLRQKKSKIFLFTKIFDVVKTERWLVSRGGARYLKIRIV